MEREKTERRKIIILIVATVLLLVALIVGWYFLFVKPVELQREAVRKDYEARKAIADRLETAQIDQRKAEDRLVEVTGQLQFFRRLYRSLEFGAMGTDPASEDAVQKAERERTWRNWLREYFSNYPEALSATLQLKAAQSGVVLDDSVRNIKVDKPPQTPEEVAPPPNGFLKPALVSAGAQGGGGFGAPSGISSVSGPPSGFGGGGIGGGGAATATAGAVAVRATGTLPQLIDFFQRLNNSPILMVVQNIKLDSSLGATNNGNGLGTTGLTPPSFGGFPGGAPQQQRQGPAGVPKVTATFNLVPYLLARGPGAPITSGGAATTSAATTAPVGRPGMPPGMSGIPPSGRPPGVSNGATP